MTTNHELPVNYSLAVIGAHCEHSITKAIHKYPFLSNTNSKEGLGGCPHSIDTSTIRKFSAIDYRTVPTNFAPQLQNLMPSSGAFCHRGLRRKNYLKFVIY